MRSTTRRPSAAAAEPFAELPNLVDSKQLRMERHRGCDTETLAHAQVWDGWDGKQSNWIELCDWLIDSKLVLTRGRLESFLRLMPPDAIFELATTRPGHNVKVKGCGQGCGQWYTFSMGGRWASLIVRRGNQFGHLCDVSALCPDESIGLQDWARVMADVLAPIPYPNSAGVTAAGLLRWPLPAREYPQQVLERAWNCCKASRMEALVLGTVQGYAYDYTAAFPSVARTLPEAHPARCDWINSPKHHSDAYYGFIRALVTIPAGIIASPVTYRYAITDRTDDPLHVAHPTGKMRVWLEKSELELIQELGYPYKILEASWGYPSGHVFPFRHFIDRMWSIREANPLLNQTSKVLANAALGLLGSVQYSNDWLSFNEISFQPAATWNPVYDATKMARMRSQIFRLGLEVGLENVVAFTIDGLITTKRMTPDKERKPGALRLESEGEYFLANDFLKDRPGDGGRWREAVGESGKGLRFKARIPRRASIQSLRVGGKFNNLGEEGIELIDLGLGAHQRRLPEYVNAMNFLQGSIRTEAIDVSQVDTEKALVQ